MLTEKQIKQYERRIGVKSKLRGRKLTEEHRNKLSLARKGKTSNRKGIAMSEEQKIKLSLALKGRKKSDETRRRMSIGSKGKPKSEEHKRKIGLVHKGQKSYWKGKHLSEETKKKISLTKHSRYTKERLSEIGKFARKNLVMPKQDTSIEIKLQNFLKELNIEYYPHQYIKEIEHGYQCDIWIPSLNLIIEADGDYWHNYPFGNDIDHIRTKEMEAVGFNVLRLWEHEIKVMDLISFKEKLDMINKNRKEVEK
jgi:very-short-patch-repair endonuclease